VKAMSNLEGMTKLMNFEMKDGKSMMMDISQIDIPAGKKVILKSGGYHVMFMNLKQDLKPGDPVELTLTFKNAGDIKVSPIVKGP
jgi:copper(I)-binding protein